MTYSVTGGSVAPGETDTMDVSFTLGGLVLNGTKVPIVASLVNAYSAASDAGRVYASPGSTTASAHTVPVATATIVVVGPVATIKAKVTGPVGTIAPGSTPSWTITLTNAGPDPLSAANGLLVNVTSSPALGDALITPTSTSLTPYDQSSGVWPIALGVNDSAQLTLTGQVPATILDSALRTAAVPSTGSITVKVVASPYAGVQIWSPAMACRRRRESAVASERIDRGDADRQPVRGRGGHLYR